MKDIDRLIDELFNGTFFYLTGSPFISNSTTSYLTPENGSIKWDFGRGMWGVDKGVFQKKRN